jgi:hypothetical protein
VGGGGGSDGLTPEPVEIPPLPAVLADHCMPLIRKAVERRVNRVRSPAPSLCRAGGWLLLGIRSGPAFQTGTGADGSARQA